MEKIYVFTFGQGMRFECTDGKRIGPNTLVKVRGEDYGDCREKFMAVFSNRFHGQHELEEFRRESAVHWPHPEYLWLEDCKTPYVVTLTNPHDPISSPIQKEENSLYCAENGHDYTADQYETDGVNWKTCERCGKKIRDYSAERDKRRQQQRERNSLYCAEYGHDWQPDQYEGIGGMHWKTCERCGKKARD